MRLRSVTPINFGPFYGRDISIPIEDAVTVLTGANDSGKTLFLTLLHLALQEPDLADELANTLCNSTYAQESGRSVREIDDFGCDLLFVGTALSEQRSPKLAANSELLVECRFTPGRPRRVLSRIVTPAGQSRSENSSLSLPIRCVWLPFKDEVRDTIDLTAPTSAEQSLLRVAFGPTFNVARWKAMRPEQVDSEVRQAEDTFNHLLRSLLAERSGLSARFHRSNGTKLRFSLRDNHGSLHPVSFRGSGIRAILGQIVGLLEARQLPEATVVLVDEPESGLHADLQHALRGLIESAAADAHVQVVMSTHAPGMINTRRPSAIRLLAKESREDQTRVRLPARPYGDNWHALRVGLGLTPADSLLYGDVTLVVEGPSELLALPLLVGRLAEAKAPGFEEAVSVFEGVHVLPGDGDSFEYFVRLAESQGNRVVVLLDSDKANVSESIRKRHPDVPLCVLPEPMESEDLVPRRAYFEALSQVLPEEVESSTISLESFEAWVSAAGLPDRMPFSKRVQRWLKETYHIDSYGKPEVLRTAVELASLEELASSAAPLRGLIRQLRDAGRSPAFPLSLPSLRWQGSTSSLAEIRLATAGASPPSPQPSLTAIQISDVSDSGGPVGTMLTVTGRLANTSPEETFEMIQIAVDVMGRSGQKLATHNTLAHPAWLAPGERASFSASVRLTNPEEYQSANAEVLSAGRRHR